MTDQEKAATFIGWTQSECRLGWLGTNAVCSKHGETFPHLIPAPDMADPRNYMRALESFKGQPYSTEILGPYEHEGMWYAVEFDRPLDDYAGDSAAAGPTGRGRTIGEAFVAALAMLYDKQHATQAGAEREGTD